MKRERDLAAKISFSWAPHMRSPWAEGERVRRGKNMEHKKSKIVISESHTY